MKTSPDIFLMGFIWMRGLWMTVCVNNTVNKDHKILNSPTRLLWSYNDVVNFPLTRDRETHSSPCFPQHSTGWPRVVLYTARHWVFFKMQEIAHILHCGLGTSQCQNWQTRWRPGRGCSSEVLRIDYNLVFQRENLNFLSHCIWEAKRYVDGDGCRKNGVHQGNERWAY